MSSNGKLRVGVAGAAGNVGRAICAGVEAADDLVLAGKADPQLGTSIGDIVGDCDVVVDFTRPDTALENALACVENGVHVVIGTTGFDPAPLREPRAGKAFLAPNFAIGAVLMMQFAVEASRLMEKAEIIELHHDRKLDAPSGTAKRTAELMEGDVPIHSVRLPGLVAHQEVLFGGVGETLSIRHDSLDRASFMPGVVLACRRVAGLETSPVVGLEHLLFDE